MRRRVLQVELDRHSSIVRGPGAHELVELVTGRPGVWISRIKGYSVQERTARNIVAAAELRNYDVEVIGRRSGVCTPRTPATRSSSTSHGDEVSSPGQVAPIGATSDVDQPDIEGWLW